LIAAGIQAMEKRESPRIGLTERWPGDPVDDVASPGRLLRLIRRRTGHRRAPAPLSLAILAGLLGTAAIVFALWYVYQKAMGYVNGKSAYQIEFRRMTLDPPPPNWYRGDAARFLDRVSTNANLPSSFSTLDLDRERLQKLRVAFETDPWVRRVERIEVADSRRVVVRLRYHEPVARAQCTDGTSFLLDREGVILRSEDVDLAAAAPLLWLFRLSPPYDPQVGQFWSAIDPATSRVESDARVRAAARLAGFLRDKITHDACSDPAFFYVGVHVTKGGELFVQVGENLTFHWDIGTDASPLAPLSAEARWVMLRHRVNEHPPAKGGRHINHELTSEGFVPESRDGSDQAVSPEPG
jgi:hypothetical protein